jgi:hypothetical protein
LNTIINVQNIPVEDTVAAKSLVIDSHLLFHLQFILSFKNFMKQQMTTLFVALYALSVQKVAPIPIRTKNK